MYKILIVGILSLAGCTSGPSAEGRAPRTCAQSRPAGLVPDNKHCVGVQEVQNEILSFYDWLLKTQQLLVKPSYAKYPKEREVDPISHLPIPKPKMSDLERREKLSELAKKTPTKGESV